ncbi:hypothetical protein [Pseudarthrobacter sp. PvP090]|uniref:hypothetical protein n=1 Tax=Pseudarthrobacter sp. PvP090 TaxID=3156393 RepID=UPI003397E429
MSEIKSLAAPKASFDRRAVVKGAAWSVPVIAAAIAAPAASASHTGTPTAAFDILTTGLSYAATVIGAPIRNGSAPSGIIIGSVEEVAVNDKVQVKIDITAKQRTLKQPAVRVIGVTPGAGVVVTSALFNSNGFDSSTTFTYGGGMDHSDFRTFKFSYDHNGKKNEAVGGDYNMKMTVTFPNRAPFVVASQQLASIV